ncbi:hypothetical protein IAT40_005778 [Kwoniella sp. CBS 6097]
MMSLDDLFRSDPSQTQSNGDAYDHRSSFTASSESSSSSSSGTATPQPTGCPWCDGDMDFTQPQDPSLRFCDFHRNSYCGEEAQNNDNANERFVVSFEQEESRADEPEDEDGSSNAGSESSHRSQADPTEADDTAEKEEKKDDGPADTASDSGQDEDEDEDEPAELEDQSGKNKEEDPTGSGSDGESDDSQSHGGTTESDYSFTIVDMTAQRQT